MDHLLVLGDDPDLHEPLETSLQTLPDLDVVRTGRISEALQSLDTAQPRLIITDFVLPDGSALKLPDELRRRGMRVPIICVAADEQRALLDGANGAFAEALIKPVDPERLRTLIAARLQLEQDRGEQAPFSVPDYLQLAGLGKRSVVVDVYEGDRLLGSITVVEGEAFAASDLHGTGLDAFRRLALLTQAESLLITCRSLDGHPTERNLRGAVDQLLLDAARVADEHGRPPEDGALGDDPPPDSTPDIEISQVVPDHGARIRRALPSPPLPRRRLGGSSPTAPGRPAALVGRRSSSPPAAPPRTPPPEPATDLTEETTMSPPPLQPSPSVPTPPSALFGPDLNALLEQNQSLRGAAMSDGAGTVLQMAGTLDAETLCAVVTMAQGKVGEATDELGLGTPRAWCIGTESTCWYVATLRDGFLVAVGDPSKNPDAVLRAIAPTGSGS